MIQYRNWITGNVVTDYVYDLGLYWFQKIFYTKEVLPDRVVTTHKPVAPPVRVLPRQSTGVEPPYSRIRSKTGSCGPTAISEFPKSSKVSPTRQVPTSRIPEPDYVTPLIIASILDDSTSSTTTSTPDSNPTFSGFGGGESGGGGATGSWGSSLTSSDSNSSSSSSSTDYFSSGSSSDTSSSSSSSYDSSSSDSGGSFDSSSTSSGDY